MSVSSYSFVCSDSYAVTLTFWCLGETEKKAWKDKSTSLTDAPESLNVKNKEATLSDLLHISIGYDLPATVALRHLRKRHWLGENRDDNCDTVYFHGCRNALGPHLFFFLPLHFQKSEQSCSTKSQSNKWHILLGKTASLMSNSPLLIFFLIPDPPSHTPTA